MFRHVVLFKWSDESSPERTGQAVQALRDWAVVAADLGTVRVFEDQGLSDGNYDVVVTAEFEDRDRYLRYAADERHKALLADDILPHLGSRAAVQHEL